MLLPFREYTGAIRKENGYEYFFKKCTVLEHGLDFYRYNVKTKKRRHLEQRFV